jgi:hypothetical protein
VYRQALRQSNSFFVALLMTALGIAASQIHVLPRPHIFTYLLTAIWITLLERVTKEKPEYWWALPLLMLAWANMHGMFVLGMVILTIYIAGDFLEQPSRAWFTSHRAKSLLLAAGFSLVATFLSPSGPGIWDIVASLGSNSYITSRIPEYQSANFHLPGTWPFLILLILTLVGLARSKMQVSWNYTLLAAAFGGLALYSSRMIPIFSIVVTPVAGVVVADWLRNEPILRRLWTVEANVTKINSASNGLVWIPVIVFLAAGLLRSGVKLDPLGQGNRFDPRFFPLEAVSWLDAHPQTGHMFNEFDWGGYLLLRLWPRQQIFMDGHTHIYGEALTREYEQVITLSPAWQDILEKYDVGWVILRRNAPVVQALERQPDWEIVYQDSTAAIMHRR